MIDATEVPIEVMLGWAGLGPSSGVVFVCSEIHSPEMEWVLKYPLVMASIAIENDPLIVFYCEFSHEKF